MFCDLFYRLHEERGDMGYEDEDSDEELPESQQIEEIEDGPNGLVRRNVSAIEPSVSPQEERRSKRRVSFADEKSSNRDSDSDSESSVETLKIEFHHTPIEVERKQNKEQGIQSPADIPNFIKDMIHKSGPPKSILKNKQNIRLNGDAESERMKWLDQPDSVPIITEETEAPLSDVFEEQFSDQLIEQPMVSKNLIIIIKLSYLFFIVM